MAMIGRKPALAPLSSADIPDGVVRDVDLAATLDLTSKTVTLTGFTATGTITTTNHGNSSEWAAAYSWGDHSAAGYQAASSALTTATTFSGDVSGTYNSIVVADNSHNHEWANITNLPDPVITLAGDVSGSATMTNLGSATITVTVADDSHTHDTRYYTETEIDNYFSGASAITGYNKTNWDTAYGWGNHASAGYLTGNQTITLTGDVSGSGTTSIAVTIADDSHNHVISNVDGLQTALDAKQDASTALTTSTIRFRSANGTTQPLSASYTFSNVFTAEDSSTRVAYFDGNGGNASVWWGNGANAHAALDSSDGYMNIWVNPANGSWYRIAEFNTSGLNVNTGSLTVAGNLGWHAGNDGSGSGLDADLLDGQQPSALSVNYANTAGSASAIDGWGFTNTGSNSGVNANTINSNGISYYTAGVDNFSGNSTDGALYSQRYSDAWQHQIAADYRSGQIALRGKNNGTWQPWRKVWDVSNDGSGSGLDADTVDGIQGSSIWTKSGSWWASSMPGSRLQGVSANGGEFVLLQDNPNTGQISVLVDGNYYAGENNGFWSLYSGNNYNSKVGFYGDGAGNTQFSSAGPYLQNNTPYGYIQIGPMNGGTAHIYTDRGSFYFNVNTLYANGNTMWTAGNDGSGSGLDADTVDGFDSTKLLRFVSTFGSGQNWDSLANTSYTMRVDEPNNGMGGTGAPGNYSYGQVWSSKTVNHNFQLYASHIASSGDGLRYRTGWGNSYAGWAEIWDSNNDGSGSGLDADLLDGVQGTDYFRCDGTYPNTDMNTTVEGYWHVASTASNLPIGYYGHRWDWDHVNNGQWVFQMYSPTGGAEDLWIRQKRNFSAGTWQKVWTSVNDGAGSGLDADLLDGQQGSYYNWRTWNDHITWNASKNIYVSGESSFDLQGTSAVWQVWTAANSLPSIYVTYSGQTQIGQAGNRGLYVYGSLTASGNVTAYSDVKLKENIEVIPDAVDKVRQLRGVTFTRNDQEDKERRHAGVIAQEVEEVLPEVVATDDQGIKHVAYGNMVGLLIEAIKELKAEVDDLKAQLKGG